MARHLNPQRVMPFGDHLEELRKRLWWGIAGVVPVFVLALIYGGPLLALLIEPLTEQLKAAKIPAHLIATSPLETFGAYLKVATVASIVIATPWLFYQLWKFVSPGLYARERRFAYLLIPMSTLLTAVGILLLFRVLLPVTLYFLIQFGTNLVPPPVAATLPAAHAPELAAFPVLVGDPAAPAPGSAWVNSALGELRIATDDGIRSARLSSGGLISQEYRVADYVNLVFTLSLVFAIAFQLPVVQLLLSWVGILTPRMLTPYRKMIVMGITVAAAVITPSADPWSMLILALALYGLFEFGIVLMRALPAQRVAKGLLPAGGTDGDQEA